MFNFEDKYASSNIIYNLKATLKCFLLSDYQKSKNSEFHLYKLSQIHNSKVSTLKVTQKETKYTNSESERV